MEDKFSVVNETKGKVPSLPILDIKNEILGEKYSLSLAYVSPEKMRRLNKTYRNKDIPTNVLSFSLSKTEGELLLCPNVVKKETKKFDRNFRELLGFLVIHGLLHLKGMRHGSRMDRAENRYDQKYFHRGGSRLHYHPGGSGRIHKRRKKS